MKVMITGSGGQPGRDVAIHVQVAGHEVYGFDRRRLDITNMQCVQSVVLKTKPDVIIHAAAYTAVDDAERDLEKAYLVNAIGTRNVVLAAEAVATKLVYISTDYVFDGEKGSPYLEYDTPNPINRYGYSKRAGELLVQSLCSRWFIVRVSWLYGAYGNNFVKTMLALASVKEKIQVVDDQHGSPTYTVDVARFLIELIQSTRYGIYDEWRELHLVRIGEVTCIHDSPTYGIAQQIP